MQAHSRQSFGVDDDSVMERLLNELDIYSAMHRLMQVGFVHKEQISSTAHHFIRMHGSEAERLLLSLDENKHFFVRVVYKEQDHSGVISTWDQWIDFVKMLIVRWILSVHCRAESLAQDDGNGQ